MTNIMRFRILAQRLTVLGLAMYGFPSKVWAKCPNLCELHVDSITVDPAFACATTSEAFGQECSCEVRFDVKNGRDCATPVRAVGFALEGCLPSSPDRPCSELQPAEQGIVIFSLAKTGETKQTFVFDDGNGEHRIDIVARVDSFGEQGCDVTSVSGKSSANRWMLPFVLVAAGVALRRRQAPH
jgi:MYXO-CTERM domain-containing protein